MTYKEFITTELSNKPRICRVTLKYNDQIIALYLEWEHRLHKWYAPMPFIGREEIGYTNNVTWQGITYTVFDVQVS